MSAFIDPEKMNAKRYSVTDMGVKNILLRFLAQILQRLPTEIEYWVMYTSCQSIIPRSSGYALLASEPPDRYKERKPNTMILINGKKTTSMITSSDLLVI